METFLAHGKAKVFRKRSTKRKKAFRKKNSWKPRNWIARDL